MTKAPPERVHLRGLAQAASALSCQLALVRDPAAEAYGGGHEEDEEAQGKLTAMISGNGSLILSPLRENLQLPWFIDVAKRRASSIVDADLLLLHVSNGNEMEKPESLIIPGVDERLDGGFATPVVKGVQGFHFALYARNDHIKVVPDLDHVADEIRIEGGHIAGDEETRFLGHPLHGGIDPTQRADPFDQIFVHGKAEPGVFLGGVGDEDEGLENRFHHFDHPLDEGDAAYLDKGLVSPETKTFPSGKDHSRNGLNPPSGFWFFLSHGKKRHLSADRVLRFLLLPGLLDPTKVTVDTIGIFCQVHQGDIVELRCLHRSAGRAGHGHKHRKAGPGGL
jgi:hypothetical protein